MHKRVTFDTKLLPYLLLAPQLFVTIAFFIWPSAQAVWQSFVLEDAFGGNTQFLCSGLLADPLGGEAWQRCFRHFDRLLSDPGYWHSARLTLVFSLLVATVGLALALLLAVMADRTLRGATLYKTFLIWPYAVAPAVAGVLFGFMFNPRVGVLAYMLSGLGIEWNHQIDGTQALWLVILAACWNQISYNFIFFLAGLQSIPKSLIEAAAIDGAGPGRRFWTIIFPLLSPTGFFLLVVNIIYAFFGTFGIVDALTQGGPGQATEILVYKVYKDGFRGQDFSGSAAQSTILMMIVIALTVVQFRFIERRVHY
ncbi:sn-glycerol-3-phosphate ABC transporter permease UgpA [Vineibacter terrae]|uniref:sn-glycerol-3-phosphate transport system permease protein UgpA n=1 Tax=Vineibacter terrae TaxID=2586908 RepID=A0A5C8P9L0_9HYPH|nr:sn-glycerol-3-phosphate ABC transporter permease UgpA [Vineibacter terrae]TXL70483.1 sn-glycerol-3-phosphate ABC transporter permease UgpA [Vineibacter terrae]